MSTIQTQVVSLVHGSGNVVSTVVKLTAATDTVELPEMSADSGPAVAQVVRSGDPVVTVTQTDIDTAGLVGSIGDVILLVSHSQDPIPNPVDF